MRADPDAAAATSVVALVSDAELTGVLADFARTGGIPVANALMAGFAKRMAEEFADETPPATAATLTQGVAAQVATGQGAMAQPATVTESRATTAADVVPLAAHGLLWHIIKAKLLQLARWLGLAARQAGGGGKRG